MLTSCSENLTYSLSLSVGVCCRFDCWILLLLIFLNFLDGKSNFPLPIFSAEFVIIVSCNFFPFICILCCLRHYSILLHTSFGFFCSSSLSLPMIQPVASMLASACSASILLKSPYGIGAVPGHLDANPYTGFIGLSSSRLLPCLPFSLLSFCTPGFPFLWSYILASYNLQNSILYFI